ncbi:MAG: hypothetical protein F9K29_00800 [Hyphomicrobiaceae bacterium]|nr:MAG: hypothetical protein F9K29_00800 [Hyphomicrobiaceae bacterium]
MKHIAGTILLLSAAVALGGCIETTRTVRGPKPKVKVAQIAPKATPLTEEERLKADLRAWCGQRHVDYQNGVTPVGSQSLASKKTVDDICSGAWR